MIYNIIMADTAKQDLRDIAFFIADKSQDIDTAKEFINSIRNECKTLDSMPYRGTVPNDRILKCLGYRFIVYKDYLIFYLVNDETKTVTIMAIFNSKKDYLMVMKRFI